MMKSHNQIIILKFHPHCEILHVNCAVIVTSYTVRCSMCGSLKELQELIVTQYILNYFDVIKLIICVYE
jgi:hypothetical protein